MIHIPLNSGERPQYFVAGNANRDLQLFLSYCGQHEVSLAASIVGQFQLRQVPT